jgi:uncharacterized protein YjbJ (UPF0337 family)
VGPYVPCGGFDLAVAIKLPIEYAVCDISSTSLDALWGMRIQSSLEIYQMKALTWVIAGVGVGVIAYIVLNQPGPEYATGDDDVEYAANRAALWGSKQRVYGAGSGVAGKVKEGIGRITGDDQLAGEGMVDQMAGAVKDTAGRAAQAVGQTVHDLNR